MLKYLVYTYLHKQKSHAVGSGDLGGREMAPTCPNQACSRQYIHFDLEPPFLFPNEQTASLYYVTLKAFGDDLMSLLLFPCVLCLYL
jgi:hypothetical protein